MSFQIVLREAAQVGYMQSNDWYTQSLLHSARHFAPACTLSIDTARTGSRPGPLGSQNDIATVTPAMRLKIE